MSKPTLFDLYRVSNEIIIKDEELGLEIPVLLRKMNNNQQQKAQRAANAVRATILALQRDHDNENRAEYENGIVDRYLSREERIEFLAATEVSKKSESVKAKIASKDEWSEEGYLEGLQEAWEDLKFDWASEDTRTEESIRVYEALKRFDQDVEDAVKPLRDREKRDLERLSDAELHEKMVDHQLKNEADIAWLMEYRMQTLFYSTYDPETKKPYFENRKVMDDLPDVALTQLIQGVNDLTVDPLEGKDSQEPQDS